jgi:predicted phage-related endonuclease
MGLVMQPAIASIFTAETGINTRPLDIAGTHRNQEWLRAHFDFLCDDGGLLEVKNYNAAVINKYSEPDEPVRIPETDYMQCLHEAVVYDAPHVYFAVLFGGQRFRYWKLEFTAAEREQFIQLAAHWFSFVKTGNLPTPETPDQARLAYPVDHGAIIIATDKIEAQCSFLRAAKDKIAALQEDYDAILVQVQNYMGDASVLQTVAGDTLATWKSAKPSKKFDAKAFQTSLPETYEKFVKEAPGSRRFLLK